MSRREEIARLLMNTERANVFGMSKSDAETLADAILALPPVETSELAKRLRANAGVHREIVPLLTRMGFANADCFNNAAKTDDEAASALVQQEAEIARLKAELAVTKGELQGFVIWRARAEKAEIARKERDEALKALGLILPLAKGYVHRNNVGSNAAYIEFAEQVLASAQKDQAQ